MILMLSETLLYRPVRSAALVWKYIQVDKSLGYSLLWPHTMALQSNMLLANYSWGVESMVEEWE